MFNNFRNVIWSNINYGPEFNSKVCPLGSTDPDIYGLYTGCQEVKIRHDICSACGRSTKYLDKPDGKGNLQVFSESLSEFLICTDIQERLPWYIEDANWYANSILPIRISSGHALWNWDRKLTAMLFESPLALFRSEDKIPPEPIDNLYFWLPVLSYSKKVGGGIIYVLLEKAPDNSPGVLSTDHMPSIPDKRYTKCPDCVSSKDISLKRMGARVLIIDHKTDEDWLLNANWCDVLCLLDCADHVNDLHISFEELANKIKKDVIVEGEVTATMENIRDNTFVRELFRVHPKFFIDS